MMDLQKYNASIEERPGESYRFGRYWMQPSLPMLKSSESAWGSSTVREPFTTIDDLIEKARDLFAGLSQLGEFKYPLDVRKGIVLKKRREVVSMSDADESRTIKAGTKTYFFDLKKTKEGKPYLVITESRFKGEGKDRERVSIVLFPEHAQAFLEKVQEMVGKIR